MVCRSWNDRSFCRHVCRVWLHYRTTNSRRLLNEEPSAEPSRSPTAKFSVTLSVIFNSFRATRVVVMLSVIVVCFCDYVFTVMGVACLGLKESLRTIFESLALALKVKSLALALYLSPCSHHCVFTVYTQTGKLSSSFYLPNNTTVCASTSIQFRRVEQQGPTRTLTAALKRWIKQLLGTYSTTQGNITTVM